MQTKEYFEDEARREAMEHRDVLLAIGSLLRTVHGVKLFSYLFKTLDVTELPEEHLEGKLLHERLGFLKTGLSIYKLACEADPKIAASILCNLERERYDRLYRYQNLDRNEREQLDD